MGRQVQEPVVCPSKHKDSLQRRHACKIFYNNGVSECSINDDLSGEPLSRSQKFLMSNEQRFDGFHRTAHRVKKIDSVHGEGTRLTITGADVSGIEETLIAELYWKYPSLVATRASFKNLSERTIEIKKIFTNYFRFDASKSDPSHLPWEFHSFQGASLQWGRVYEDIRLGSDFAEENPQWTKYPLRFSQGSGVLIIDMWTRQMGMAIACAETRPVPMSMPVRVQPDQKVDAAIESEVAPRSILEKPSKPSRV